LLGNTSEYGEAQQAAREAVRRIETMSTAEEVPLEPTPPR